MQISRCEWVSDDPIYQTYHDDVWGIPVYDDRALFEKLILDGAQAGLSWITILKRQAGYQAAFDGFDPEKMARYDAAKIEALMQDTGIIRNRMKINSAIQNAQAFLKFQETEGSFSEFLWGFVGGEPIINCWQHIGEMPAQTDESQQMSRALKKRGFSFVGPTICYAFMQACGLVNDHTAQCFKHPCTGA